MRRITAFAAIVVVNVVLIASVLGAWRVARERTVPGAPDAPAAPDGPTAPDAPAAPDVLDIRDYRLGDILEGDGPPMERFAPDAFPAAPEPVGVDDIPAPEHGPVDFKHYPEPDEIVAFVDHLAAEHPDLVEVYEIGQSWQERPIRAIRVANEALGDRLDRRPAMYIDGQHHARELISNQVALYNLWWLVHFYGKDPLVTHLLDTRVVYIVPSVNPDGNTIALNDYQVIRKTANPACCDDDGDGKFDEDPSFDYGYDADDVSVYEFDLDWANAYPDNPLQGDWRNHQVKPVQRLGRHTGALGGPRTKIQPRDQDADGRSNEDERGGTDPNRNYDWHWEEGVPDLRSDAFRGPEVWSEPETKALRDFLAELDTLSVAVSYHSGTDLILYPWGYSTDAELPDAPMYELLTRKGSQLTEVNGFTGSPRTWIARGLYSAAGSSVDYIYGKLGAYAMAPETYGGSSRTRIERLGATGVFTVGQSTAFGFNPRQEDILATTDRWNRFAMYLLAATPNIELNEIEVRNDLLRITVGNDGVMPVTLMLEVVGADGQPFKTETSELLHAGQTSVGLNLSDIRPTDNRLKISAVLRTGTEPHVVDVGEWGFRINASDQVILTEGSTRSWVDLSAYFGGWWADDAWNAPQYRCPQNPCPPQIFATPPVTPNPNVATLTPFPSATPASATMPPPMTPTATSTTVPTSPTVPTVDTRGRGKAFMPALGNIGG